MAGLFTFVLVVAGLGAPVPGAIHLVDAILVLAGFGMARSILRRSDRDDWLVPAGAFYATRLYVPVLATVALVIIVVAWPSAPVDLPTTTLGRPQINAVLAALTLTSNLFAPVDSVSFPEIDHLWLVSLIAQVGLAAPLLLLAGRRRIGRNRRAVAIAGTAALVAGMRAGLLMADQASNATVTTIRFDPILAGLALGVMPQSMFHRHPVRRWTRPALLGLVAVIALPVDRLADAAGRPEIGTMVGLAVLGPVTAALTVILVWAEANNNLPSPLARLLDRGPLAWLADRGPALYTFHLPFLFMLGGTGTVGRGQWTGWTTFALALTLTLAAATICHRSIIEPILGGLDNLDPGRPLGSPDTAPAAAGDTDNTDRGRDQAGSPPTPETKGKAPQLEPMQRISRRPRGVPNPVSETVAAPEGDATIDLREERTPKPEPTTGADGNDGRSRWRPPLPRGSREIAAEKARAASPTGDDGDDDHGDQDLHLSA